MAGSLEDIAGNQDAPDAVATNTDDSATTSGGGTPTTHKLVIDGETREVSTDELVAIAQKAGAADKRLQEATELLKTNRHKIQFAENFRKAGEGDQDALRAIVKDGFNIDDDDQVDEVLKVLREEPTGDLDSGGSPSVSSDQVKQWALDAAKSDPTFKEAAELVKTIKAHGLSVQDFGKVLGTGILAQSDSNRRVMVKEAVTSNKFLGGLFERGTSKNAVVNMAKEKLDGYLRQGNALTPEVIRVAVQETADWIKNSGMVPNDPDVALGEFSDSLDVDSKPDEGPKMPNINDPEAHGNAMTKLIRDIARRGRGASASA